jgi:copper homeostasis protein
MMTLEVCIDSVESALAAQRGGAKRIELCSDLIEGGVTPGAGLIASVRRHAAIDLFVMIRPRGGDFLYSDLEFEVMQLEIEHARQLGADGIVLGLLDEQGNIDIDRTRELVALAAPLPVTFHRAIDMSPNLPAAVLDVIATGASRILTSGGCANAVAGMAEIGRMVEAADGRVSIMAGGGLNADNIATIAQVTGAREFHSSARATVPSRVRFRKEGISLGDVAEREYSLFQTQEAKVRALLDALKRGVEQGRASSFAEPRI